VHDFGAALVAALVFEQIHQFVQAHCLVVVQDVLEPVAALVEHVVAHHIHVGLLLLLYQTLAFDGLVLHVDLGGLLHGFTLEFDVSEVVLLGLLQVGFEGHGRVQLLEDLEPLLNQRFRDEVDFVKDEEHFLVGELFDAVEQSLRDAGQRVARVEHVDDDVALLDDFVKQVVLLAERGREETLVVLGLLVCDIGGHLLLGVVGLFHGLH